MVLLGYFYRETRDTASIDAAWQVANESESWSNTGNSPAKSLGTAALKSSSTNTISPMPKPVQQARPTLSRCSTASSVTSDLPALSRQTRSKENIGTLSDGSLFTFTQAEREAAQAELDTLASSGNISSGFSGYASYTSYISPSSLSSLGSAVIGTAALKTGLGTRGTGAAHVYRGARSTASSVSSSPSTSPEIRTRGRSSSVFSRGTSVSSVTSRSVRSRVECDDW